MREVWLIQKRPGGETPDEDLFPPERVRQEQVRTLRAAIDGHGEPTVLLLPAGARTSSSGISATARATRRERALHRRAAAGADGRGAQSQGHGQSEAPIRTVTPIVLDRLPDHNFMPVVLPENLRDPMGNFMLHVGGRQLLLLFFAMLFTGAGLFAAGFFLHRVTVQDQAAARGGSATPAETRARPARALTPAPAAIAEAPPRPTVRAAPAAAPATGPRHNPPERTAPVSKARSEYPGAPGQRGAAARPNEGRPQGPKGTVRVQVGDIPVYVR